MTAAAIVAGMPMATVWMASPSAPQSQWARPRASSPAQPQPMTPARRAFGQPRRSPSSRSDTAVMAAAMAMASVTRTSPPPIEVATTSCMRTRPQRPPVHGGASAPHSFSPPVRSSTASTSARRGWKASALSAANSSSVSASAPKSNS